MKCADCGSGSVRIGRDERVHVLDDHGTWLIVKRANPGQRGIRQELEQGRKLIDERLASLPEEPPKRL